MSCFSPDRLPGTRVRPTISEASSHRAHMDFRVRVGDGRALLEWPAVQLLDMIILVSLNFVAGQRGKDVNPRPSNLNNVTFHTFAFGKGLRDHPTCSKP